MAKKRNAKRGAALPDVKNIYRVRYYFKERNSRKTHMCGDLNVAAEDVVEALHVAENVARKYRHLIVKYVDCSRTGSIDI